jgi:hypothetical protein
MDERQMYSEINALVGAVAKALSVSEIEAITAIEQGRLGMEMLTDADGRNYIQATCDGKTARIYQGAIFRPADSPDKPAPEGGCSCGG